MKYLKYIYKNHSIKVIIEEDVVGFYLIIYDDPQSEISNEDYLVDSLEEALVIAEEDFNISRDQWMLYTTVKVLENANNSRYFDVTRDLENGRCYGK